MQLQPYKIKVEVPAKIQDMELSLSISETIETLNARQQKEIQKKAKEINLKMSKLESETSKEYIELYNKKQSLKNEFEKVDNTTIVQTELVLIISKYLAMNIKGRAITNDDGLLLLSEVILNDHGNLGLNEVAFALKRGIVGSYGVIYNDIGIDTVFGWITQYKERDRPKIKEKDYSNFSEKYKRLEGFEKEITYEQFLEKNPDIKIRNELKEIENNAKKMIMDIDIFKKYFELQGKSIGQMQDTLAIFSKKYFDDFEEYKDVVKEIDFIKHSCIEYVKNGK